MIRSTKHNPSVVHFQVFPVHRRFTEPCSVFFCKIVMIKAKNIYQCLLESPLRLSKCIILMVQFLLLLTYFIKFSFIFTTLPRLLLLLFYWLEILIIKYPLRVKYKTKDKKTWRILVVFNNYINIYHIIR